MRMVARPVLVMNVQMELVPVLGGQRSDGLARQLFLPACPQAEHDPVALDLWIDEIGRLVLLQPIRHEHAVEQAEPPPIGRGTGKHCHPLHRPRTGLVDAVRPWFEVVGMEIANRLTAAALQQIGQVIECHSPGWR